MVKMFINIMKVKKISWVDLLNNKYLKKKLFKLVVFLKNEECR
jgi:hypothetical protein